jgi:hypothetical protein
MTIVAVMRSIGKKFKKETGPKRTAGVLEVCSAAPWEVAVGPGAPVVKALT